MQVLWPEKVKSHFRVYHPINSGGTTWLRESDLVFVHKRSYAVLSWSHTDRGDVPEMYCELNRKLLKHDRPDDLFYRYEGEIRDRAAEGKTCRNSTLSVLTEKSHHLASRLSGRPRKASD